MGDEPFFALNGDILTDLDLTAMLAFHRERGAGATIALHHVEDARAFGLVLTDADGRVRGVPGEARAARSPATSTPARTCWIRRSSRRGRRATHVSIEREVFPVVIAAGHDVFGFLSDPYWLDLGTPAQYLAGALRPVRRQDPTASPIRRRGSTRRPTSTCARTWVAGWRWGREPSSEPEAQIDDSVIHRDGVVEGEARVVASVVGPGSRVGSGATLMGCVLGEGSRVADGADLDGARVPAGSEAVGE